MDWRTVERELTRAFGGEGTRLRDSRVWSTPDAVSLGGAMEQALTGDEQEEWGGTLEGWAAHVSELLDEAGVDRTSLVGFYWDGFGPMSWVAGIDLIGNEARRYLAYWDEMVSYRVFAAVEPADSLAVSSAVATLIGRNGTTHGLHMFNGPPKTVTNYAPELLPDGILKQALFDLMQWWDDADGDAWVGLAEEHYGRMVEPNHLTRSLDVIAQLPDLTQPGSISQYLEQRREDNAEMPDHARQRLFAEWFATAYEEAA